MYAYVFLYIRVFVYIRVNSGRLVCIRVCSYAFSCGLMYSSVFVRIRVHPCVLVCIRVHWCVYSCVFVYIRGVYSCVFMYIRVYSGVCLFMNMVVLGAGFCIFDECYLMLCHG